MNSNRLCCDGDKFKNILPGWCQISWVSVEVLVLVKNVECDNLLNINGKSKMGEEQNKNN